MIYYVGPQLYKVFKKYGIPEHMLYLTKPLPLMESQSIWQKIGGVRGHIANSLKFRERKPK